MKRLILTIAMIAAGTTAANAQYYGNSYGHGRDNIDARQARQADRIRDGYRDGSLTGRETRELIEEQRRIQQLESRAKADGRVSRDEAERIRRAQREASQNIREERHDRELSRRSSWGYRSEYRGDHRPRWGFRRWW